VSPRTCWPAHMGSSRLRRGISSARWAIGSGRPNWSLSAPEYYQLVYGWVDLYSSPRLEQRMSVVSVKVPSRVKQDMRRVKDSVKWPEEIRNFIIHKLEEERRKESIENAEKVLEKVRRLPKGSSAKLVREDRDSHH